MNEAQNTGVDSYIKELERLGIGFANTSTEDAKKFLTTNTYYQKLRAYLGRTPQKDDFGGMDFQDLVELSKIDFSVSRQVLTLALAIEHTLKIQIWHLVESEGEDFLNNCLDQIDRQLVDKWKAKPNSSSKRKKPEKFSEQKVQTTDYSRAYLDTPSKENNEKPYVSACALWELLESLSFRKLINLYEAALHKEESKKGISHHYLKRIQELRNAAAPESSDPPIALLIGLIVGLVLLVIGIVVVVYVVRAKRGKKATSGTQATASASHVRGPSPARGSKGAEHYTPATPIAPAPTSAPAPAPTERPSASMNPPQPTPRDTGFTWEHKSRPTPAAAPAAATPEAPKRRRSRKDHRPAVFPERPAQPVSAPPMTPAPFEQSAPAVPSVVEQPQAPVSPQMPAPLQTPTAPAPFQEDWNAEISQKKEAPREQEGDKKRRRLWGWGKRRKKRNEAAVSPELEIDEPIESSHAPMISVDAQDEDDWNDWQNWNSRS